jgi:hypothetical protein
MEYCSEGISQQKQEIIQKNVGTIFNDNKG